MDQHIRRGSDISTEPAWSTSATRPTDSEAGMVLIHSTTLCNVCSITSVLQKKNAILHTYQHRCNSVPPGESFRLTTSQELRPSRADPWHHSTSQDSRIDLLCGRDNAHSLHTFFHTSPLPLSRPQLANMNGAGSDGDDPRPRSQLDYKRSRACDTHYQPLRLPLARKTKSSSFELA
jgi:hypothetical protein